MKSELFKKLFGVMCCLSFLLLGSAAFGQSFESPSGEPPHGLKLQGAAKGTKVNATLAVEFTDVVGNPITGEIIAGGARVTVRLRHGSQLATLFTVVVGPLDLASPDETQAAILAAIGPQIVNLFGSPGQAIVLKDAEEFSFVDGVGASPCTSGDSKAMMIDLVLALN